MKKSLIALAVLAASSASFAQVSITGNLTMGYTTTTVGGVGSSADVSGFGVDTSEIDFVAKEDLGGGMSAKAELALGGADRSGESGNGTVNGRNAKLTLVTGVGAFVLSTTRAPDYLSGTIAGVGAYYGGWDGKVLSPRTNRDTISYVVPVGAVTLGLSYQEAPDTLGLGVGTTGPSSTTKQSMMVYSATYAQGPLSANVTYLPQRATTGAIKDQTRLSGSYDLGVVKLGLGGVITTTDTNPSAKSTDLLLGVSAPMGALTFGAQFVQRKIDDIGFTGQGVGTISGYSLETTYALSKRTSVIANYARWTPVVNLDASSQVNVLLSHSF